MEEGKAATLPQQTERLVDISQLLADLRANAGKTHKHQPDPSVNEIDLPAVIFVGDPRQKRALLAVHDVVECDNKGIETSEGGFFRVRS